jgi:hypothetical protein
MPAGMPYFAWIDVGETTFTSGHMRWDESVFSFTLSQDEGDPASLTIAVRRPRNLSGDPIGLLGPGRKIWCWFAFDCGPDLIRFRGRLVGVPTSLFEDLVTLEFVAKPVDVVAQKEALAASLRVLPFYDEVVIDPARRNDPDVVLEGYTAIWHYDRETHVITISDEITGEDGTVSFDGASDDGKVLYDGLGLTLTSGPLARVDVAAEFSWTQQAVGTVDLTRYLIGGWPSSSYGKSYGAITSYTMTAADWPKTGAGIGDGWTVAQATAYDLFDWTVKTNTSGSTLKIISPDGSTQTTTQTFTNSFVGSYAGTHAQFPAITTQDEHFADYQQDGDRVIYVASYNRSFSAVGAVIPEQFVRATLVAGYKAQRPYTERVSFTLFADVQHILTDPEDGEALRIDDIRSINLSEGSISGFDARRSSYIATARGNQSLEHLIAFARTHLMKRARVVEIKFAPKLSRMPEITLRKSLFLAEPRVGEALGKIIGYSLALDGTDGRINCEVRIGCAIGKGGNVTAIEGAPTYCTIDYVGSDYQQFLDRTVLVSAFTDSSVGYQPPLADPNDDGLNFLGGLSVNDVIEQPLTVELGPLEQQEAFETFKADNRPIGGYRPDLDPQETTANKQIEARAEMMKEFLRQHQTRATFKLKSMTREFATDYEVQVTDLKIPAGYDLEAV